MHYICIYMPHLCLQELFDSPVQFEFPSINVRHTPRCTVNLNYFVHFTHFPLNFRAVKTFFATRASIYLYLLANLTTFAIDFHTQAHTHTHASVCLLTLLSANS